MKWARTLMTTLVAVLLALGLAGCGGGSDESSDEESVGSLFQGSLSEDTSDREHYERVLFALPYVVDGDKDYSDDYVWTSAISDGQVAGLAGIRTVTPPQDDYAYLKSEETDVVKLCVMVLRGKHEGTSQVTFRLALPWEDNSDDDVTCTFGISVDEALNIAVISFEGDDRYAGCYRGYSYAEWDDVLNSLKADENDTSDDYIETTQYSTNTYDYYYYETDDGGDDGWYDEPVSTEPDPDPGYVDPSDTPEENPADSGDDGTPGTPADGGGNTDTGGGNTDTGGGNTDTGGGNTDTGGGNTDPAPPPSDPAPASGGETGGGSTETGGGTENSLDDSGGDGGAQDGGGDDTGNDVVSAASDALSSDAAAEDGE